MIHDRNQCALVSFIWRFERAVADRVVADEVDVADLDLRAFVDVEDDLHQLRAAGQRLDRRLHLGELVALLRHQVADDALDAPDDALIEERVEAQRDAGSFIFSSTLVRSTLVDPV